MSVDDRSPGFALNRRHLLQLLGLAGAGVLASSRSARAATPAPVPAAGPMTRIEGFDGAEVAAVTGPLGLPAVPAGARLAACLIVPGTPGGVGQQQLVRGLAALTVSRTGGGALESLGEFAPDPAAEHAVARLLAGLAAPGPVDVFGFSALAAGSGQPALDVEVRWRGLVRGNAGRGEVQSLLSAHHAVVVGTLTSAGTFDDFASYVRVRRLA